MTTNFLLSGFGGQGILFAGKQLAKTGMDMDLNVSWLPSYGPEMRGGAANCSVIISDKEIGAPIVTTPDVLVALNLPSFLKFESAVKAGGILIADSAMVPEKSTRTDIGAYYIPATKMASDAGVPTLANMVLLGKVIKETGIISLEGMREMFEKIISAKRQNLIDINLSAIELGYNFQ